MTRRPRPRTVSRNGTAPVWTHRRRSADTRDSRASLFGALAVIAVAGLILFHGLSVATGREAATRTLRATLPALTDLDQALAAHEPDIKATAALAERSVEIPGLPLSVRVPREAAEIGGDTLRQATVSAMAEAVYRDGSGLFRAADAQSDAADSIFSKLWATRRSLDLFTSNAHDRFSTVRLFALIASVALFALVVLQVGGQRRAVASGSVLAVASVLALVITGLGRLVVWVITSGDSEVSAEVIGRAGQDATMSIVGVAGVAFVAGLVLAVAGSVAERLLPDDEPTPARVRAAGSPRRYAPEPWEDE